MLVAGQHPAVAAQNLDEQLVAGLGRLLRILIDGGAGLEVDAVDLPGSVRGKRAGRDDVVLKDHDRPVLRIHLTGAVGTVHGVHAVFTRRRPTGYTATVGDLLPALPLYGILVAAIPVEILGENTRADHLGLKFDVGGRAVALGDRDQPGIDAGIGLLGLAGEAAVRLDRQPARASDSGKGGAGRRQLPGDGLFR